MNAKLITYILISIILISSIYIVYTKYAGDDPYEPEGDYLHLDFTVAVDENYIDVIKSGYYNGQSQSIWSGWNLLGDSRADLSIDGNVYTQKYNYDDDSLWNFWHIFGAPVYYFHFATDVPYSNVGDGDMDFELRVFYKNNLAGTSTGSV